VLVVDDVADNRVLLSQMLRATGAQVSVAKDGLDALQRVRSLRPDIVFMDVRMPVMDGVEALQRMRKEDVGMGMVCIAVSAAGWSHESERYLDVGFDDFIAKPYRFETICECIERHTDVRFERASAETMAAGGRGHAPDLSAVSIPEPLRERLLSAARLNAFTEIEAALSELQSWGGREHPLVAHLRALLRRYDSRAIVETVERLAPKGTGAP
jgi:CheY-like chemotaxis protein